MQAPERFTVWMTAHEHKDPRFGWVYHYHPRSDRHSIELCKLILEDLLEACPVLTSQALADKVIYGINFEHTFPNGKSKTLDLAIGTPKSIIETTPFAGTIKRGIIDRVFLSCEAKAVMTEHGKSKPRVFDELSSSHEIVHQGDREAIAVGITAVNIAETFVSPLRQHGGELHVSKHKQPKAAAGMITHLRGLPIRDQADGIGFDAYSTFVVDCDNQGPTTLWADPPAPQPEERDHYDTFLDRIIKSYDTRFSNY